MCCSAGWPVTDSWTRHLRQSARPACRFRLCCVTKTAFTRNTVFINMHSQPGVLQRHAQHTVLVAPRARPYKLQIAHHAHASVSPWPMQEYSALDLFCGRFPSKAVREMAGDAAFMSNLLSSLSPSISPNTPCVAAVVAGLQVRTHAQFACATCDVTCACSL